MEKSDFEITYIATEAIGMKLPVVELEGLLNSSFSLADYGEGIQKIFLVFLAVPSEDKFHQPHINYTDSESHLELALRLPYKDVLAANSEASMRLLKETFLEGVKLCDESGIESFNWQVFHQELKKVF